MDLLGVSKTHIHGIGSMKLGNIEFVWSGREDGVHRQRVELVMNNETASSCLGIDWIVLNDFQRREGGQTYKNWSLKKT